MEKSRTWFNWLAVATMIGFAVFCILITLAAAWVPHYRDLGWEPISTEPQAVQFSTDDAAITYEQVTTKRKQGQYETRTTRETKSVPTGRRGLGSVAREVQKTHAVLRRLFAVAAIEVEFGPMAISHDFRELAFLTRGPSRDVVHRSEAGVWRSLAKGTLPEWAQRLNATRTGTLAERLANPSLLVWVDAAVETTLHEGARGAIIADRLLGSAGDEALELVDVLLTVESPATLDDAARVAATTPDAALARRILDLAAQRAPRLLARPDGSHPPTTPLASKAAVAEALVRRDWGDRPSVIVDWMVTFVDLGGLDIVSPEMQKLVLAKLKPLVDGSFEDRLTRIVKERSGIGVAVAYVLLRKVVGEPIDPKELNAKLVEEARAWMAARRSK